MTTSNDPFHGVTLQMQVEALVAHFGWEALGQQIAINCFRHDPSIKSSLKFLRRTPWARAEVEALWLNTIARPQSATSAPRAATQVPSPSARKPQPAVQKPQPAASEQAPAESPWTGWKSRRQ